MTEEQQIEEIAVKTCALYRGYLDKTCAGNHECNFECHQHDRSEKLYNAGYRKVVFCKDCENYVSDKHTKKHCFHSGLMTDPDDYCSYGHRKDDNNE